MSQLRYFWLMAIFLCLCQISFSYTASSQEKFPDATKVERPITAKDGTVIGNLTKIQGGEGAKSWVAIYYPTGTLFQLFNSTQLFEDFLRDPSKKTLLVEAIEKLRNEYELAPFLYKKRNGIETDYAEDATEHHRELQNRSVQPYVPTPSGAGRSPLKKDNSGATENTKSQELPIQGPVILHPPK
jgi:hypothetical protein